MARQYRNYGDGSFYFDEKKQIYRGMVLTPLGKRLTKSSKYAEVVQDWLNEQRLLIGRSQHVEPNKIMLGEWVKTWLEVYSKPNTRQRTYERYESLVSHIEPIETIPILKLNPTHIQSLYNDMEEEGYSGETRKKVHNLLNNALKQALVNQIIRVNPVSAVKPPKPTRDEIQVFTKGEIELLLQHSKGDRFYPALLLAITSGMRLGEVLGVRWQDIDMVNKEIHVRQQLQSTNKKGIIFEPPKTRNGKRKINVPTETIEALKEHKKIWNESKLLHPDKKYDLVFVTNKHTPIGPQNFTKRFWNRLQQKIEFFLNDYEARPMREKKTYEKILEECRQKKDWVQFNNKNFHVLRHTYATTLLAAGVPIIDVSRALGHAKVSTTLDIYGHAIPENKQVIADKISAAFLN